MPVTPAISCLGVSARPITASFAQLRPIPDAAFAPSHTPSRHGSPRPIRREPLRARIDPFDRNRWVHSSGYAFGTGHRRNDSKIKRSRVISLPCATAASTAARATAGFQPSPVSAALACVQRIAASSLAAPMWATAPAADATRAALPSAETSVRPRCASLVSTRVHTSRGVGGSVVPMWVRASEIAASASAFAYVGVFVVEASNTSTSSTAARSGTITCAAPT